MLSFFLPDLSASSMVLTEQNYHIFVIFPTPKESLDSDAKRAYTFYCKYCK